MMQLKFLFLLILVKSSINRKLKSLNLRIKTYNRKYNEVRATDLCLTHHAYQLRYFLIRATVWSIYHHCICIVVRINSTSICKSRSQWGALVSYNSRNFTYHTVVLLAVLLSSAVITMMINRPYRLSSEKISYLRTLFHDPAKKLLLFLNIEFLNKQIFY